MKCPTCGDELKVIVVEVPVYLDHYPLLGGKEVITNQVVIRYDEEEQVCDCPRCTGGY